MTGSAVRVGGEGSEMAAGMQFALFLSTLGLVRGGLETIASTFAQGLAARGHKVTCVAGAWPGRPLPDDLACCGVEWLRLPVLPLDLAGGFGTSTRNRARRLKAQSLSFVVACRCHPSVRHLLATAGATLSLLEIETVYLSRWRTAKRLSHISYFPGVIDRSWIERDKSSLRLAISRTLVDASPGVRIDGVLAPGIHANRLRRPFVVRSKAQAIFFAGRLEINKGVWELLRIFEALASDRPALGLRLAGDGPLRGPLREWVERRGLAGRVRFLGTLPPSQVQAELSNSDLFLFPTHYESFGLAALEAQAAGVPVVCSDLPVMQEATGGAALLLPRRDVTAWVESVGPLLDDVRARQRLSQAGRRNAEQLTWTRAIEKLEGYLLLAARQA